MINHNNDPTGAQGEERPIWFNVVQRYKQFAESQTGRGRAQAQRANMRQVQGALGAVQAPLGPGNPAIRSEVAAENPEQAEGPLEVGAGVEIRQVNEATNNATDAQQPAQQPRRRRRRGASGSTGNRNERRNRPRTAVVQDEIDARREQLDTLTDSINEMANSVTQSRNQVPPSVLVQDSVGSLRQIMQDVNAIAASMGENRVQETNQRLYFAYHGLLQRHAAVNQYTLPPLPDFPNPLAANNVARASQANNQVNVEDIESNSDSE